MRQCSATCTPSMSNPTRSSAVERRGLPCGQLRRRLGDEAAAHRALARPAAPQRDRHGLQSCGRSAGWPPPRASARARADSTGRHRPWSGTSARRPRDRPRGPAGDGRQPFGRRAPPARHRAGPRPAVGPRGHTASRRCGAVLFEHRLQDLQAGPDGQFEQLGPGVDEQIERADDERDSTGTGRATVRDSFMAAPCLRGFRLGLVTTRVTRAATEPPLQISTAIGTSPVVSCIAVASPARSLARPSQRVMQSANCDRTPTTAGPTSTATRPPATRAAPMAAPLPRASIRSRYSSGVIFLASRSRSS